MADRDRVQRGVDGVIATIYARSAHGYSITDKVLDTDVAKRIRQEIAKLDKRDQKPILDDATYRLERFKKEFLHAPTEVKREILKEAYARGITVEEATSKKAA